MEYQIMVGLALSRLGVAGEGTSGGRERGAHMVRRILVRLASARLNAAGGGTSGGRDCGDATDAVDVATPAYGERG